MSLKLRDELESAFDLNKIQMCDWGRLKKNEYSISATNQYTVNVVKWSWIKITKAVTITLTWEIDSSLLSESPVFF